MLPSEEEIENVSHLAPIHDIGKIRVSIEILNKNGKLTIDEMEVVKQHPICRKKLGMTQKQLAEKLGKSDKSVSKWERGICLPDVSVYLELCEILGISLNEFLAGEDIEVTNVEKKSEDTLIQISKDSSHKQRYLKKIIAVLLIAVGVFAMEIIRILKFIGLELVAFMLMLIMTVVSRVKK